MLKVAELEAHHLQSLQCLLSKVPSGGQDHWGTDLGRWVAKQPPSASSRRVINHRGEKMKRNPADTIALTKPRGAALKPPCETH